jgi:hypothetical protein
MYTHLSFNLKKNQLLNHWLGIFLIYEYIHITPLSYWSADVFMNTAVILEPSMLHVSANPWKAVYGRQVKLVSALNDKTMGGTKQNGIKQGRTCCLYCHEILKLF